MKYKFLLAQEWWLDFANSRDYFLTDRTTEDKSDEIKNHWAEISLYIMYQRISNMQTGSGQIHLLFNPQLIHNWDGQDYSHLFNPARTAFLHPGTGAVLENLGYYDNLFFNELTNYGTLTVMGKENYINDFLPELLYTLLP